MSLKDRIGQVFGVKRTCKKSQGVSLRLDQLHIRVNRMSSFDTVFELTFQLLDIAS